MATYHFGVNFVSYNVHGILHLTDDVKKYKCTLDKLSAFPFENFLGKLKRMVRSYSNPVQQVIKRCDELYRAERRHVCKPTPRRYSTDARDRAYLLKKGGIFLVDEVEEGAEQPIIHGRKFRNNHLKPCFNKPCNSMFMDIFHVTSMAKCTQMTVTPDDLGCKGFTVPTFDHDTGFIFTRLLHMDGTVEFILSNSFYFLADSRRAYAMGSCPASARTSFCVSVYPALTISFLCDTSNKS